MEEKLLKSDKLDIVKDLEYDYAEYVNVSTEKDRQAFDQSLDDLLTKLDEYLGLIDVIRSDTNLCLNRTIPSIYEKSLQLQSVFDKIDQLEKFVGVVKSDVAQVEALLDQAESELASKSPVTKLFSSFTRPSFFGPKRSNSQPAGRSSKYVPPSIFKTSDYLEKTSPVTATSKDNPTVPTPECESEASAETTVEEKKDSELESSTDQSFEEASAEVKTEETAENATNEAVMVKGEE